MQSFAYAAPGTVRDALRLLRESAATTAVLAGGTDLLSRMKDGVDAPTRIVSLAGVAELREIRPIDGGGVAVGAGVTLDRLRDDPLVRGAYPAIVQAIEAIRGPQVVSRATLGGNLCQRPRCWYYRRGYGLLALRDGRSMVLDGDNRFHAVLGNDGPAYFVHPSTIAPALIAHGATLVVSGETEREIPVSGLYRIPRREGQSELNLDPGTIVREVRIPRAEGLSGASYKIAQREGLDWPLVAASVVLRLDSGVVREASVVVGHAAPVPWVARDAAKALIGKRVTPEIASAAGAASVEGARSLGRNGYKIRLTRVAVARAVRKAAGFEVPS